MHSGIFLEAFFLKPGLALLPRLEGSGTVLAHCNLCFLGSSHPPASAPQVAGTLGANHHTLLIFVLSVETGYHHVAPAGLRLLSSSDPPALASQSARLTGMSHRAWPGSFFFCFFLFFFLESEFRSCHAGWSAVPWPRLTPPPRFQRFSASAPWVTGLQSPTTMPGSFLYFS